MRTELKGGCGIACSLDASPVIAWLRRFAPVLCAAAMWCSSAAQTADDALANGVRLQQQGDLERAIEEFRRAVELAPDRIDALSNLSVAYLQSGRPAQALPGLQRARAALPEHAGIAYFLGLAYFQTEHPAEARDVLAWLLDRQPGNGQALHLYGLSLLRLGDLVDGIRALERVVAADPNNRQAAYTLGSAYIKAGQAELAETLISERLRDDQTPEALLIKGSLQLAKKQSQEALELLQRARSGNSDLPMLRSQIGVALLYSGRREGAEEEFRAELAANPGDFNANAFLGWLLQQDGEQARALELLERAYALNESDSGVQYLLAQAHSAQGAWSEAEMLLHRVVEAQPDFTPAHVMLARAYAKLKRRDEFRRQQEIIKRLNARQQERDLRGVDQLYDGSVLSMPRRGAPASASQRAPRP